MSKTKQFCETSSFFELDNIRNEAVLRDFPHFSKLKTSTRRRMARERRGAESSVVSTETLYYKTIY